MTLGLLQQILTGDEALTTIVRRRARELGHNVKPASTSTRNRWTCSCGEQWSGNPGIRQKTIRAHYREACLADIRRADARHMT